LKALLGVAGLLGLIGLAFGEQAAAATARHLIWAALIVVLLVAIDIMTRGVFSQFM
jgi:hypothetical protein